MFPVTAWEPPKSKALWLLTRVLPKQQFVGMPHDIKVRALRLRNLEDRRGKNGCIEEGINRPCSHSHWAIAARQDPVGGWSSKTRSGKIMRRILKKVAANLLNELGDTSTLADPSVVDDIVKNRQ